MLLLALFIALIAFFLLILSNRQRHNAGIPPGRIVYTDTNRWTPVEKPLYDSDLGLIGKPDYLIKFGNVLIPVEVKSGGASQQPYESHVYQLAAYCLLAQRVYGVRPSYGVLHYPNQTFEVDFTTEMESALLDVLSDIQKKRLQKEVRRSHNLPSRCKKCGYFSVCDQALT
jgi:CRISPR-associated exonuclease Cas4